MVRVTAFKQPQKNLPGQFYFDLRGDLLPCYVAENATVLIRRSLARSFLQQMLFPRNSSQRSNVVAFIAQARQWAARGVLFLAGLGLIFIAPSHYDHRGWEVLAGVILLISALGDLLLGILLAVAARHVKPRKLGLD